MSSVQRPLPQPGGLVISPHGNKVAYHLRTRISNSQDNEHTQHPPRYASNIWVADVGEAHSAHQVTHGSFDDHAPQWSADGALLLFKSDRHPREHVYDPEANYHLYRLWFGVDVEPAPILVRWPFTQFCPWPKYNRFLLATHYGYTGFDQRFIDAHSLRPQRYSDCAIHGRGCVMKMVPCGAPDDGRVAMLVQYRVSELAESTFPPDSCQLWIGGDGNPYPLAVGKTKSPETPFSFSISHIGWAGKTLYFLSKEIRGVNDDGTLAKPAIYRMGHDPTADQDEEGDQDETYSKVYSGPDGGDDCRILGITSTGDDLLVHERDVAGDDILHLLLAGVTVSRQKKHMFQVVALNPRTERLVVAAILATFTEGEQTTEVYTVARDDNDTVGSASLFQLSDHFR